MRIQPVFFASPVYYQQENFITDARVMLDLIQ